MHVDLGISTCILPLLCVLLGLSVLTCGVTGLRTVTEDWRYSSLALWRRAAEGGGLHTFMGLGTRSLCSPSVRGFAIPFGVVRGIK